MKYTRANAAMRQDFGENQYVIFEASAVFVG
jgi:hypothetical protein